MSRLKLFSRLRLINGELTINGSKMSNYYSSDSSARVKKDTSAEYSEGKQNWNILSAFASEKASFLELHRYNPFKLTAEKFKMWKEKINKEADLYDQKFVQARHATLGNDLASAHFIVFRGGKVKFIGQTDWIKKKKDDDNFQGLPKKFTDGWFIVELDASGLPLRYEGFSNLTGLHELRTLILRDCPHIDDWCVDKISCQYKETLEYLDLSGCNITERSLSCLYRFDNLKTLVLENVVKTKSFEFACLLVEDAIPNLTVEGVKYLEIPVAHEENT